jgi:hypothetical protein
VARLSGILATGVLTHPEPASTAVPPEPDPTAPDLLEPSASPAGSRDVSAEPPLAEMAEIAGVDDEAPEGPSDQERASRR